MIDGVVIKKLRVIADERGYLMEMLRADDEMFLKFGQVYLTAVHPGVVKAWHLHRHQTDYMACVSGMVKLVLSDPRGDSETHGEVSEIFMGDQNPVLVKIPQMVHHGFKGISTQTALIVNTITELYNYKDPDEYRLPWDTPRIPYDWACKNG